jgi:RNA polymerase sigma-70 factor (ECF subfamily)
MLGENPLLSESPAVWDRLIEALGPSALLAVISLRMGERLRQSYHPEDVLQDALAHAWRDRRKCDWRGVRAFRAWLLQVIEHRLQNLSDREEALKRGGGRSPLLISAFEDPGADDSDAGAFLARLSTTTPSRRAVYREEAEVLRAAVESLPDELRDVVRLKHLEERPVEEVAQGLGLGVSAVKHRLRKGLEQLQLRLRAAGMTPGRATGS